jgi:hypothetical protein
MSPLRLIMSPLRLIMSPLRLIMSPLRLIMSQRKHFRILRTKSYCGDCPRRL